VTRLMALWKCKTRSNGLAGAFTLVETVTALTILALFTSGVLVTIDNCISSATNSGLQMRAFEIARENMEMLLTADSLEEGIEQGESERYPGIEWQTTVETFYEPITSRMWIRGVCSASYEDTEGERQSVELMHWLTDLSKEQLMQLAKQDEAEMEALADQLIDNFEDAAEYAGVDVETVEQWVDEGMVVTEDGEFIKQNLDLYKQTGGRPTEEQRAAQIQSASDLQRRLQQSRQQGDQQGQQDVGPMTEEEWLNQIDPSTGLTNREVQQMDFMELFQLLMEKKRQQ